MIGNKQKIAFFLPNIFTALNMACGFVSIILSMTGQFDKACMILILGSIFDSVDGRVARLTGTQSSFGEQFDSMSDIITFGIAPSFLVYFYYFQSFGRVGIVISFIFLLCAALRLARFNSNIEKVGSVFFQGLPSPAAALAVIGLVLLSIEFSILKDTLIIPGALVVLFASLMITNVPFNSLKQSKWIRKNRRYFLIFIFILILLTLSYHEIMVGLVIYSYIFISLIYFLLNRGELGDIFKWEEKEDDL
ncbi:MAG: CDP-diacylglycerol--serine O-phosphatidyltransferase [Bacteriovoracaceae bacterium]